MENKSTKTRSKNFTNSEISVLVNEVERRRSVLFGPLRGPNLTQYHRDRAWDKVIEAVNAVSPTTRKLEDIKKKFRDLKTRTKHKANMLKREAKKTGGGENDGVPLSAEELKVISFIGDDSIEGIKKGIDTFRKNIFNMPGPSTSASQNPTNSKEIESPPRSPSPVIPFVFLPPPSPDIETLATPSNVPVVVPPPEFCDSRKVQKRNLKSRAIEEMRESTQLQAQQNGLLQELLLEFRDFKQQFLEMKRKELEMQAEYLEFKKRRKN